MFLRKNQRVMYKTLLRDNRFLSDLGIQRTINVDTVKKILNNLKWIFWSNPRTDKKNCWSVVARRGFAFDFFTFRARYKKMEPMIGFEPMTCALRMRCSTD